MNNGVHIQLIFYNNIPIFFHFPFIISDFSLKFSPPGYGSTALAKGVFSESLTLINVQLIQNLHTIAVQIVNSFIAKLLEPEPSIKLGCCPSQISSAPAPQHGCSIVHKSQNYVTLILIFIICQVFFGIINVYKCFVNTVLS